MREPVITREYARANKSTFAIPPVARLLDRWLDGVEIVVDPFCGESTRALFSNDLSVSGKTANEFLDDLIAEYGKHWADAALLDPPYSPRQIEECYKGIGRQVGAQDTQNSRMYREAIERLDQILKPGGIGIRCGWNSCGFGNRKGYRIEEILMVCHAGSHNDTIITVCRKGAEQ